MISSLKNAIQDPSQIFQKDQDRIHFTTHQNSIKRVQSLRKVEPEKPNFTPDIHEIPFKIYPERTKT